MASITYWNQLRPVPRVPSVTEGLAAAVRDPAWLLCRQWQLGEFQGADAGSPAFTTIASHITALTAAQVGSSAVTLAPGQLLEPLAEAEPITSDLATRVELGQTFESLAPAALHQPFRAAYPIAAADPGDDAAAARFRAVCAGRAIDGVALYTTAKAAQLAHQPLPAAPVLDPAAEATASTAIAAFIQWVEATWGQFGTGDPAAWDATQLEYNVTVSAGPLTLTASPDSEAALDWYAFDLASGTPAAGTTSVTGSVVPGHVRFPGMPNPRWWDFETSKTDFGALSLDPRDLSKLLFADFLLLHGDDWFLAPLDVPAGSLCWVDALTVTDVFGITSTIPRADAAPGTRWTLFSTTGTTGTTGQASGGAAPFLVVPASAAAAALESGPLEEVHLLRDETADLAWAIEHLVQGPSGAPRAEPPLTAREPVSNAPAPLAYQLSSPLPPNWFPLLPVTAPDRSVALVGGTVEGGPRAPAGRLLPTLFSPGFQLPDREITRAGVVLCRVACRTRTADGGARLWFARRSYIGAGEASSGLRYDEAQRTADSS
jgi:hypothetical protein